MVSQFVSSNNNLNYTLVVQTGLVSVLVHALDRYRADGHVCLSIVRALLRCSVVDVCAQHMTEVGLFDLLPWLLDVNSPHAYKVIRRRKKIFFSPPAASGAAASTASGAGVIVPVPPPGAAATTAAAEEEKRMQSRASRRGSAPATGGMKGSLRKANAAATPSVAGVSGAADHDSDLAELGLAGDDTALHGGHHPPTVIDKRKKAVDSAMADDEDSSDDEEDTARADDRQRARQREDDERAAKRAIDEFSDDERDETDLDKEMKLQDGEVEEKQMHVDWFTSIVELVWNVLELDPYAPQQQTGSAGAAGAAPITAGAGALRACGTERNITTLTGLLSLLLKTGHRASDKQLRNDLVVVRLLFTLAGPLLASSLLY